MKKGLMIGAMAFALVGRDTPVFEEIAELRRASAA